MPKEYLLQITEEQIIGGETVETIVGDVCKFQPKTGGAWNIRQHRMDGPSYLWKGDVDTFDENTVELDPELEPLWEAE